jgi:hypothetical protein
MKNIDTWASFLMLIGFIVLFTTLVVLMPFGVEIWPTVVIVGGSIFLLGFAIYGWLEHKKEKEGEAIVRRVIRADENGGYDIIDPQDKKCWWGKGL